MKNRSLFKLVAVASVMLMMWSCQSTKTLTRDENKTTPASYRGSQDTTNSAYTNWRVYFHDDNLIALIDTALKNNTSLRASNMNVNYYKALRKSNVDIDKTLFDFGYGKINSFQNDKNPGISAWSS